MSGFKYGVGDILENESGRIVEVVSIIKNDALYPYVAEATDDPDYSDCYAEHELAWPKATHFKVGQPVKVVGNGISDLMDIVDERGVITSIDDPVLDSLPIQVLLESGGEWFFSPIELKVIEDVEDVEEVEEGEEEEREKFLANWEGGAFDVNLRGSSEAAKILFVLLGSVIPVNDESKSLARLLDQLLLHFPDPDKVFYEAVSEYEPHFRNGGFYVGEPDEGFVFSSGVDPKDRDSELAIYRQEIFRLNRELERSNTQRLELIELAADAELICKDLAHSIEKLRDEQCKRNEEYNREESK